MTENALVTNEFDVWFDHVSIMYENMDEACFEFARKQKLFMLAPVAIFDDAVYLARIRKTSTLDVEIEGPLYTVTTCNEEKKYLIRFGEIQTQ